ncbi:MAG: hypothetical protein GY788_15465, partial [bacterium]|nr:hypothetical protein [bacterium]
MDTYLLSVFLQFAEVLLAANVWSLSIVALFTSRDTMLFSIPRPRTFTRFSSIIPECTHAIQTLAAVFFFGAASTFCGTFRFQQTYGVVQAVMDTHLLSVFLQFAEAPEAAIVWSLSIVALFTIRDTPRTFTRFTSIIRAWTYAIQTLAAVSFFGAGITFYET